MPAVTNTLLLYTEILAYATRTEGGGMPPIVVESVGSGARLFP
jgi:hypothetical protein